MKPGARRIAGMWWHPGVADADGLGWTLRYGGTLAPSDRLMAAEMVDAYHRLIMMPRREREALIAKMRRELSNAQAAKRGEEG